MDVERDLRELGQLLSTAAPAPQLRSVTSDAENLQTPGCWLRFDRARHDLMDGYSLDVTAHLVVGEQKTPRAHKALSDLFTALRPTFDNVGYSGGDLAFIGLVLPTSSTPLPALAVPLTLTITEGSTP